VAQTHRWLRRVLMHDPTSQPDLSLTVDATPAMKDPLVKSP